MRSLASRRRRPVHSGQGCHSESPLHDLVSESQGPVRHLIAFIAVSALSAGPLTAQMPSPKEFHDQLAGIIAEVSGGRLPAGDTSVTWRPDSPILYHTARRDGAMMRTGMARSDGLVGALEVRWGEQGIVAFGSRWSRPDSVEVDWTGRVSPQGIEVRGPGGDRQLALPGMRWLVADYAMEDQFTPLFASLRPGDSVAVAVLRPYLLKWDTVTVVVSGTANALRVRMFQGPPAPLDVLLAPDAAILRTSRGTEFERRPLETTVRYEQYQVACRPKVDGRSLAYGCQGA